MTATFLDRPVEGDEPIFSRRADVTQLGPKELKTHLDTIFADVDVTGVVWQQYTPYFNDGEPCEFGVHEVFVGIQNTTVAPEETFEVDGQEFPSFSSYELKGYGDRKADIPGKEHLLEPMKAINSGSFDNILYKAFGDHCKVIALRDKFIIEEHEHE